MLRIAFLSLFSVALLAQTPKAAAEKPQTKSTSKTTKAKKATPPPPPPAEPEKPKENKVVGRIGDVVYYESDFWDYLPMVMQPAQLEEIKKSPEMQREAHKSFLEAMLLVNKAKKEGVEQWPEFQTKLVGLTNTLLIQEFVNKNVPELEKLSTPTEEQLKAYYEANKDSFKAPDTATARHILVMVRSNENETNKLTDEEAKNRIDAVLLELVNGKSWQDVAKEYSDDPGSKEKGGLYENFDPARMVPEFAQAVRTQEIGKVGKPVKTQFGYHIILVESRKIDVIQTFDEAKGAVQQQLSGKMRTSTWLNWVNSLRTEMGYAEGEEVATKDKETDEGEK